MGCKENIFCQLQTRYIRPLNIRSRWHDLKIKNLRKLSICYLRFD
ncbi:unnamed protein product [Brugia timori]|uniref:Uncharacterized protein n=1 Tax=Brugia timori TaxID=42155 RepID=A0A0R3RD32_9BILA|nr:unnamed protein product [Brugia timori]